MNKKKILEFMAIATISGISVLGLGCSTQTAPTQTTRVKPIESPTPGYKPPKRVSRDVIKSDNKEQVVKAKAE